MIKVSESDFYSIISKINAHPHSEREFTQWEDLGTRQIIGRSTHGWLTTTVGKEEFFLSEKLSAGIKLDVGE